MQFACYTAFEQLPRGVDALFAKAERESVFWTRQWFETVARYPSNQDQSLQLACVIDEDRVLALLPLVEEGDSSLVSMTHVYSSLFSFLIAENEDTGVYTCLAEGLKKLPYKAMRLTPVDAQDPQLNRLQSALQASGYRCHRAARFPNWFHRTRGETFDDYMAGRPSQVRNTIARKQRKLQREHEYHIRLYSGEDLPQGLADYHAVYLASWKGKELYPEFVDHLARQLAAKGWLRLAVLYIDGQPAAAQYWFVTGGTASIFKLAYDEAWKAYSPGSILINYLMQHVIDHDKVEEIDFLYGNDAYKKDWMSEKRERWGLYCAQPAPPKGFFERLRQAMKF